MTRPRKGRRCSPAPAPSSSSHGILFRTHRLEGDIGRAVGAFVEERGADLVVAGAHGGRRRSWAVGSQAERLIQLTTVPVIINR